MILPPLMYFFPKWSKTTPPDQFKPRFEKSINRSNANAIGPGGHRGTLFSPFENTIPCYNENAQRWQKFYFVDSKGEKREYMIGVSIEADATDFERESMIPGSLIALEHGEWSIPIANPFVETCDLPYYDMPDGLGGWYREFKEDYIQASEVAITLAGQLREAYIRRMNEDDLDFELDEDEFRHHIATMIGVNYDLTVEEMAALRLFDKTKYLNMMFVFLDAEEMMKMIMLESEEANGTINPSEAPADGKNIVSGGQAKN